MDALVSVCSGNLNVIMVWAWMFWSAYALGTLVSVCSGHTNVIMVWAWMLWSAYALGTRTLLWFGHGCFGQRMLWEHERYYVLGMDGLVSVCSGNTNVILLWPWMLDACVSVCSRNTNDILDARRRVAAKTVIPKFYTLDPKVLPNEIAAELFAF